MKWTGSGVLPSRWAISARLCDPMLATPFCHHPSRAIGWRAGDDAIEVGGLHFGRPSAAYTPANLLQAAVIGSLRGR